jgi:hypothetical protein
VSQTATLGNVSSPGYWLRYTDGSARFGGNVSIGANLTVQGLITTGALNSNTVATTTVVPNSISAGVGISRNANVTIGTQVNNSFPILGYVLGGEITVGLTTPGAAVYVFGGASLLATWTFGNPSQYFRYRLLRRNNSNMLWDTVYDQRSATFTPAIAWDNSSVAYIDSGLAVGSYTYIWTVYAVSTGSTTRTTTLSSDYNTLFAQELKR